MRECAALTRVEYLTPWATWWAATTRQSHHQIPHDRQPLRHRAQRRQRHDRRLGIFVPLACVRELHRAGKRLPFGIEVVAFAEEEASATRPPSSARALIGHFNPAWLDQKRRQRRDHARGHAARERLDDIAKLQRDPAQYLGFIRSAH